MEAAKSRARVLRALTAWMAFLEWLLLAAVAKAAEEAEAQAGAQE